MTLSKITFTMEMRDPIYGYIFLTNYEEDVLDSKIFQRLDRIFQMPTSQFVYPSAKHTRKTHSLGVMHLSHNAILNILYRQSENIQNYVNALCWGERVVVKNGEKGLQSFDQNIREEWWNKREREHIIQGLRLAAMLHDVGHAPLSHLFEDVCKKAKIEFEFEGRKVTFNHELMSLKIIKEKVDKLGIKSPFTAEDITEILKKDGKAPPFLHQLISGAYDCDKLDYLARDAYATGAIEFGGIDCARIIDGLRVNQEEQLCVSISALDALMKSFDAVQYMYTSVYYHKTARIFDFMVTEALLKIPEFLREIVSSVDKFLEYDDYCFLYEARKYAEENNVNDAVELFDDFRYRRKKYKEIYSHRITIDFLIRKETLNQLKEIENSLTEIAKNLGIVVDYRPDIRPVGIDIEDLPVWLTEKHIYDPSDGKTKKIKDISEAYHRRLTQYVILFRVYANRDQLKDDPKKVYNSEKDKIAREAKKRLNELCKKYEELRG